jgi:anti-sigma factor RsiW
MYWDDYDIQAYFDGELAPERRNTVRRVIRRSPSARRRVNELAEMERLLLRWWFEKRNLH